MSTTSEIVERLLTAPGPLSTEDRRAAAARLDELERENARMREALVPFGAQMPNLTMDDFRRARAALEPRK